MRSLRHDLEITNEVQRELKWDRRLQGADIGVAVSDGLVTLVGHVDTYAKRAEATRAAHRVRGVLDVVNDVEVHPDESMRRSDSQVARAVRQSLEWNALIDHKRIESTVADGWVTLSGTVDSLDEREDVGRAVESIVGVRGVINRITVAAEMIDREAIAESIRQALERRALREADDIEVNINDGIAVLKGPIESPAARRAVLGVVRSTAGIREVVDRMTIDWTL